MKLAKYEKSLTEYIVENKVIIKAHTEAVRISGNYKDLTTRIAWDCFWSWKSKLVEEFDNDVYDAWIETLAKKCLRNAEIKC